MILPVCSAISGGSLAIGRQTTELDLPVCLVVGVVAMFEFHSVSSIRLFVACNKKSVEKTLSTDNRSHTNVRCAEFPVSR